MNFIEGDAWRGRDDSGCPSRAVPTAVDATLTSSV